MIQDSGIEDFFEGVQHVEQGANQGRDGENLSNSGVVDSGD